MSFYENKILPHIINCGCSNRPVMELRSRVVPKAEGVVLEVGMGSGLNLQLYNPSKVSKVFGLEPSVGMRTKAKNNLQHSPVLVEWLDLPGEKIPLADHSVDTVVLTYTLCSIADWPAALTQMHRVLKPEGKLLFCEHGLSPEPSIQKWQHRLNPTWKKLFGGCNLNRPIVECINSAGFAVIEQHNDYIEKAPRFAGYMFYGEAMKVDSELFSCQP